MSKEKLKKDFTKTLKSIYSLRYSLEKKGQQLNKHLRNIHAEDIAKVYNNTKNLAEDLAYLSVKNKLFYRRETNLLVDTLDSTLKMKLATNLLNTDTQKIKQYENLNNSILLNIILLDLEYTKLENIHNRLKAKKISVFLSSHPRRTSNVNTPRM